jgi:hypothetical protein
MREIFDRSDFPDFYIIKSLKKFKIQILYFPFRDTLMKLYGEHCDITSK